MKNSMFTLHCVNEDELAWRCLGGGLLSECYLIALVEQCFSRLTLIFVFVICHFVFHNKYENTQQGNLVGT